jgi:hypothetical protein
MELQNLRATLMKAAWTASKNGHNKTAALIAAQRRSVPDRDLGEEAKAELLDAARCGDEGRIKKLFGLEVVIGDRMADGSIYAGMSPNSGKKLFAAAANAPRPMTFQDAERYANSLDVHGHKDWRLPSLKELRQLFQSRAAIGGFATPHGSRDALWYWSRTEVADIPSYVWVVDLREGHSDWVHKKNDSISSRAVRAEP